AGVADRPAVPEGRGGYAELGRHHGGHPVDGSADDHRVHLRAEADHPGPDPHHHTEVRGTPMTHSLGRRQLLRLGLGGAAGAAGLAGLGSCARGPGGSPEGSFGQPRVNVPPEYAKRKPIVAWSAFGGLAGDAMAELARRFNRSQQDIYLDVQFQGSYGDIGQKLVASMQSGVAPDMVSVAEDSQGQLQMQEVAYPLHDSVSQETLDRMNEVMLDQWTVRGQVYQIPFARSTPIFYYNKDIYAKAGLPDRGPRTWSEFREWATEIHKVKNPQGDPTPCLTGS